MATGLNQAQKQFGTLFKRLSTRQIVFIVSVVLVALVGIIGLVSMMNKPSYGILFSNLESQDAAKIVEKLKEKGVPYQLGSGGKTIEVPHEKIYELRLELAGEGLPQSSIIGYEIFDKPNFGVTDFVQKLNYRRALEGELARTILQLEEVEAARVHIVIPEKTLFAEDQKSPTASVFLKLKSGRQPAKESIQGIAHLVASSVEGLDVNNVTILDAHGNLLSSNKEGNSLSALTSKQYELQANVESYLAAKAQSLLDGVLGRGNAIVRVAAELDFKQAERTIEQYDPSTVVRSEETKQDKTVVSDSVQPSTRTSTITNYEVSKTIEHVVDNAGNIKRLSVAVLVNGTYKVVEKNGEKTSEYVPRSNEQMEQLTDIVKKAIGFDARRNDQVSVVNVPFDTNQEQEFVYKNEKAPWYKFFTFENDGLEKILLLVAMIASIILLRSLLGRLKLRQISIPVEVVEEMARESPPPSAAQRYEAAVPRVDLPAPDEVVTEEALLRGEMRKRVAGYIANKPSEAARLMKIWLLDTGEK